LTLKMSHTCTQHSMLIAVAGNQYHGRVPLHYISCTNAVHGPSPVWSMFRDWTEAKLDRYGLGSGPRPRPWPLTFWSQNLTSSSLCPTASKLYAVNLLKFRQAVYIVLISF